MFAGMSPRALIYNKNLKLKHKHLIIQEAAGFNDEVGQTFLRQLLSEGKVRYITVQSTKDGLDGVELPPVEGPTGLLMTTTERALHEEDETRMLSYNLDESPEKLRDVLISQTLLQGKPPNPIDTKPWHELDAYIRKHDKRVSIPFLNALARSLPVTHNRVVRDFPHVLSLIEAHALLHQRGRGRTDDGSIIATVDDYAAVRALVDKPLSQGLEAAVAPNVREIVDAVRRLLEAKGAVVRYDQACAFQRRGDKPEGDSRSTRPRSQRRQSKRRHGNRSRVRREPQPRSRT